MKIPRRSSALATPLVLAVACLALAACGSSGSTSSSASASTSASGTTGPGGAGAGRFAALRSCLAKQGVTLPQRPAGAGRPSGGGEGGGGGRGFFGGGGGGGGFGGATGSAGSAKLRAALQKCGGTAGFGGGQRRNFNNPTTVAALTKFASCMRSNGINLPAPNTSGTGPVFDTKGLDTTSAAFKAADAKCSPDLPQTFGRRPGGTSGPAGAGGGSA